jgi:hypothetical protein
MVSEAEGVALCLDGVIEGVKDDEYVACVTEGVRVTGSVAGGEPDGTCVIWEPNAAL